MSPIYLPQLLLAISLFTVVYVYWRIIRIRCESVRCLLMLGGKRWIDVVQTDAGLLLGWAKYLVIPLPRSNKPPFTLSFSESVVGRPLCQVEGLSYLRFFDVVSAVPAWVADLTSLTALHLGPSPAPMAAGLSIDAIALPFAPSAHAAFGKLALLETEGLQRVCSRLALLRTLNLAGRETLTSLPEELGR
jgi:hypothetical protein